MSDESWEPSEPEDIEAMIDAEMAFRESHDLLDDDDWYAYCMGVGEDWANSQEVPPEPEWMRSPEVPPSSPLIPRLQQEPEQAPAVTQPVGSGAVPIHKRGPYQLTPIEAPFYDALAETGLTFSVQQGIQHADKQYRLDFLVYYDGRVVAVELDGHDFHKTKEQRGRDAARDRWLLARGIPCVRFTGSEVYADAEGCVRQLLDVVRQSQARP